MDGVAKMLSKSDVERLKGINLRPVVDNEEHLGNIWRLYFWFSLECFLAFMAASVQYTGCFIWIIRYFEILPFPSRRRNLLSKSWSLQLNSTATEANRFGAFGRLCVRTVLHVLNKQKVGRGPKGFENLQAIGELFAKELMGHAADAASVRATEDSQQSVRDVLTASPQELALLQNQHMQIGEW